LHRFLTQPFAVTEAFTGMPGRSVAVSDTIAGCKAILAGECDAWQESSLYMVGTLDEAREKETATRNAGQAKPQPAKETKPNGGSDAKAAAPKPAGAPR
jgi:F-type H+-transporting ATPase subunit beta